MCGIAGIVSFAGIDRSAERRAVAMRDILAHRGPDEIGLHSDPYAVLAHRRLSIIDLSTGQQPLSNEDGTVWVVYNGEIYNHAAVRRDLEKRGHRYRTRSDTETIVHAYEQWGDDCVHRFRGMFAFAVWDAPKRRLLLARDRLGVKPLYWARRGDVLLFGSEIKAILASGLVDPQANVAAIPELLSTRYIAGADTLFRGVQKLLPGQLLIFERGDARIRQYLGRAAGSIGRAPGSTRRRRRPPGCRRSIQRASRGIRPSSSHERRSARRVPLGRNRQQRRGRDHGTPDRSAAPDLFRGIRRARLQRARVRPRGRQGSRRRGTRSRHQRSPVLWCASDTPLARG